MKIACISLGCHKNQVDLDVMVHILLSAGHETVAELGEADVILVNTCGFIESAKTEAIENILEACAYKQQNPELKVIVTGCLAERYRSQIEEEIPEVIDSPHSGLPAGRDKENPPAVAKPEPYKTHLAYVKERRTEEEADALLGDALQQLRERRGQA